MSTEKEKSDNPDDSSSKQNVDQSYNVYDFEKPKDAIDGLARGATNIAYGALGGAALMVYAPFAAASSGYSKGGVLGGLKGFGVGLGTGVIGGVAMAAGGVLTGTAQIGRGIYNTPTALRCASAGMEFDEDARKWIVYDLMREADQILPIDEDDFLAQLGSEVEFYKKDEKKAAPKKAVADRELYDVLGVAPSASTSEIKRAYYIKARENHPDKHQGDPHANEKFQKVGEAYQILSDAGLREQYDNQGRDGVNDLPKLDSAALFAMIFGSEKFDEIVGELSLATQMSMERGEEAHPKFQKLKQRKRQIRCAVKLARTLDRYHHECHDDEVKFKELLRPEVEELAATPFGGALVNEIGINYLTCGKSELGDLMQGVSQTGRNISSKILVASSSAQAAYATVELQSAQRRMRTQSSDSASPHASYDSQEKKGGEATVNAALQQQIAVGERELQQKLEKVGMHMFKAMWHITELDIQSTLTKVCHKVCHDRGVDINEMGRRKKALVLLGEVFISCGCSAEKGLEDLRLKISSQMQAAAEEDREKRKKEKARRSSESGATGVPAPAPEVDPTPPTPVHTVAPSVGKIFQSEPFHDQSVEQPQEVSKPDDSAGIDF